MDKIIINIEDWNTFKSKATALDLPVRGRIIDDDQREAFIDANDIKYRCYIKNNVDGYATDFDNIVNNDELVPQKIAQILNEDITSIFETSHNFSDKTTWWFGSLQSINETLTGSGTSWSTMNQFVIDLEHGKYLNEDDITETGTSLAILNPAVFKRDPRIVSKWGGADLQANPPGSPPHFLKPVLKDYQNNILTRVEQNPGTGQYSINYSSGNIITGDDFGANAPVFSYHYADSSVYEFWVHENKSWYVSRAEVQTYSSDVDSAAIIYDVVMDHPLLGANQVVKRRVYKSTSDVMDACNGAPQVWIDNKGNEWWVFPWDYAGTKSENEDARIGLHYSAGMKIRLSMRDDIPYSLIAGKNDGKVSVTLYGVSKNI